MAKEPVRFVENRRIAIVVLLACIVFSIFVMGPAKIRSMRSEALDVFRSGTYEGYTLSVYTDLRTAAENAGRLAAVCEGALGAEDEDVLLLTKNAETILSSDDPETMLKAFSPMILASDRAYQRLSAASDDESAIMTAQKASAVILSSANTIEKDGYFALAASYNREISRFPANLLSGLFGLDALPTGGK